MLDSKAHLHWSLHHHPNQTICCQMEEEIDFMEEVSIVDKLLMVLTGRGVCPLLHVQRYL